MKRTCLWIATCASCALMTLAGCQSKQDISPSPGMGDPYVAPLNDPQISILAPELRPHLGFHPAIITRDDDKPMIVEIPVRNLTYNDYLLEYRIIFYDANGRELSPVMGWEFIKLDPKQVVRMSRKAMTNEADDYRLEVRWSR